VDMTDSQLEIANRYRQYHAEKFGYCCSNVEFKKGVIEDLKSLGIKDSSIDLVISNCVINLTPNKEQVFKEIHRVLKEGGELYFSDVYSDRRIPEELKKDQVLWGECLSGALYTEDFRRMMARVGFMDCRVVESSPISVSNPGLKAKVGDINFVSQTIRTFKISSMEDRCEEFGQQATYLGTLSEQPEAFVLDAGHVFPKGVSVRVCGNSAAMVEQTRFGKYFKVTPAGPHQGLFKKTPPPQTNNNNNNNSKPKDSCGPCGC